MKNDDFRSSFGRAPVVVLVIFNVAQRRRFHSLAIVLWTPKVHCGGKGVNKERRKWVITGDLTRPGPRPGEFILLYNIMYNIIYTTLHYINPTIINYVIDKNRIVC